MHTSELSSLTRHLGLVYFLHGINYFITLFCLCVFVHGYMCAGALVSVDMGVHTEARGQP